MISVKHHSSISPKLDWPLMKWFCLPSYRGLKVTVIISHTWKHCIWKWVLCRREIATNLFSLPNLRSRKKSTQKAKNKAKLLRRHRI